MGGLHVAEPPELTFGRWLEKRGSHEVSCPLSTLGTLPPDPRNCPLGTHSGLLLPPLFSLSSVPPRVRVCALGCSCVCLAVREKGDTHRQRDRERKNSCLRALLNQERRPCFFPGGEHQGQGYGKRPLLCLILPSGSSLFLEEMAVMEADSCGHILFHPEPSATSQSKKKG